MNNSKKVGFGQEELMDHIMVSINLGSKQAWLEDHWDRSCQDWWWEICEDQYLRVFFPSTIGLQQVLFYSFYNMWSMIGSPPATLHYNEFLQVRGRGCISFYSWSFYGCFDHMLRYHFPDRTLVYRSFIKNWI